MRLELLEVREMSSTPAENLECSKVGNVSLDNCGVSLACRWRVLRQLYRVPKVSDPEGLKHVLAKVVVVVVGWRFCVFEALEMPLRSVDGFCVLKVGKRPWGCLGVLCVRVLGEYP